MCRGELGFLRQPVMVGSGIVSSVGVSIVANIVRF